MFNLIMFSIDWVPGNHTVPLERLFEHTDDSIADQFRDGKRPLLDKLIRLPCLFMHEGRRDEVARIGRIISARISGSSVVIEISFDADAPTFLNSAIYANRLDFDMPHDFEFSRNHWAVKNADLYRTVLRHLQPRRQQPRVFSIAEHEKIEPQLMSVMMPFASAFDAVYASLSDAAGGVGLRSQRADDIWEDPAIIQDVVNLIDRSREGILTSSMRLASSKL